MSVASFFSGFIVFALIGLALSPSEILSEQITTALQSGLFAGFFLAATCLFLYFTSWFIETLSKLVGSKKT